MKLKVSCEHMDFMPGSKLSKELIATIQRLKDFPQTYPETKNFKVLWEATLDFVEKDTIPSIKKIFKERLGIIVTHIHCREIYAKEIFAGTGFSITRSAKVKRGDKAWFFTTEDVISGKEHKANIAIETAEKLNKFLASFDQQTGQFKLSDNFEGAVECELVFDLASVLYTDFIEHVKLSPLIAEETSAIMIHEAGHVIGEMSYLKFTHFSIKTIRDAFKHFNNYASPQEKLKFIKTNGFNEAITDTMVTPTTNKMIQELADKAGALLEPDNVASKMDTTLFLLNKVFSLIINCLLEFIILPFVLLYYVSSFRNYDNEIEKLILFNNRRMSDFNCIGRQVIEAERIADEFVVHHGLGSYMASAMKKRRAVYDFVKGKGFGNPDMPHSKTSSGVFGLCSFLGMLSNTFEDQFDKVLIHHPSAYKRIDFMIRSQIRLIKENLNNPLLLKLGIEEYEKLLEEQKNKTNQVLLENAVSKIFKALHHLSGLLTLGFVNMNQRSQIESLIDAAESIMHNDIFIAAQKLKIIVNKEE